MPMAIRRFCHTTHVRHHAARLQIEERLPQGCLELRGAGADAQRAISEETVRKRAGEPSLAQLVSIPHALQYSDPWKGGGAGAVIKGCNGPEAQLLYSLRWPAEAAQVPQEARWRLLHACRQAAAVSSKSKSKTYRKPIATDLVAQWRQEAKIGEVFCLQVPLERPEAPPCPLDLHLLAPAAAEVSQLVPVTVKIRNASLAGPVSFYFVAESTADLAWVGCERSEIIRLPANEYHSETIQAYFSQPGVYNLNRFRLFVVGMPSSTVPASEQAPMAFAVPFERLLHVQASGDTVGKSLQTAIISWITTTPGSYQPEAFNIKYFDITYYYFMGPF
eukprot:s7303_g2.t1